MELTTLRVRFSTLLAVLELASLAVLGLAQVAVLGLAEVVQALPEGDQRVLWRRHALPRG